MRKCSALFKKTVTAAKNTPRPSSISQMRDTKFCTSKSALADGAYGPAILWVFACLCACSGQTEEETAPPADTSLRTWYHSEIATGLVEQDEPLDSELIDQLQARLARLEAAEKTDFSPELSVEEFRQQLASQPRVDQLESVEYYLTAKVLESAQRRRWQRAHTLLFDLAALRGFVKSIAYMAAQSSGANQGAPWFLSEAEDARNIAGVLRLIHESIYGSSVLSMSRQRAHALNLDAIRVAVRDVNAASQPGFSPLDLNDSALYDVVARDAAAHSARRAGLMIAPGVGLADRIRQWRVNFGLTDVPDMGLEGVLNTAAIVNGMVRMWVLSKYLDHLRGARDSFRRTYCAGEPCNADDPDQFEYEVAGEDFNPGDIFLGSDFRLTVLKLWLLALPPETRAALAAEQGVDFTIDGVSKLNLYSFLRGRTDPVAEAFTALFGEPRQVYGIVAPLTERLTGVKKFMNIGDLVGFQNFDVINDKVITLGLRGFMYAINTHDAIHDALRQGAQGILETKNDLSQDRPKASFEQVAQVQSEIFFPLLANALLELHPLPVQGEEEPDAIFRNRYDRWQSIYAVKQSHILEFMGAIADIDRSKFASAFPDVAGRLSSSFEPFDWSALGDFSSVPPRLKAVWLIALTAWLDAAGNLRPPNTDEDPEAMADLEPEPPEADPPAMGGMNMVGGQDMSGGTGGAEGVMGGAVEADDMADARRPQAESPPSGEAVQAETALTEDIDINSLVGIYMIQSKIEDATARLDPDAAVDGQPDRIAALNEFWRYVIDVEFLSPLNDE